jgi:hypothetical protein
VAMLGLLGLRFFEATGANIADLGEEHGHRVLRVCGKGGKVVQIPLPPARRPGYRPGSRPPGPRAPPAQPPRHPYGPPRRHPAAEAPSPSHRLADENSSSYAPPHFRHHHARCRG